jgi:predicted Na+-dependent transporter
VRKKKVPLQALHVIMILDLLALMTAYAAGSCRKFRTSIFVLVVVCCVVVYLLVVIILSSGIAKWLKKKKGRWLPCWGCPSHDTATDTMPPVRDV